MELVWEGSLDEGTHQANLELVEGDFTRVVTIEPVEHLVEELFFLLL